MSSMLSSRNGSVSTMSLSPMMSPGRRSSLLATCAHPEFTFPDVLFGAPPEDWLKVPSLPVRPLAHLMLDPLLPSTSCAAAGQLTSRSSDTSIPVLYGVPAPCGRAWHAAEAGAEFHVDIFGSVFYLLTLYEEAVLPDRDKHGRFPSSASMAAVEGFWVVRSSTSTSTAYGRQSVTCGRSWRDRRRPSACT